MVSRKQNLFEPNPDATPEVASPTVRGFAHPEQGPAHEIIASRICIDALKSRNIQQESCCNYSF